MTDIPIPPPHEPLITPEGRVNDNWYRYFENQSRSVNSATTALSAATQQYTFRYEPTFVSSIPRVDNETQVTGESMKYSEWWKTTYAVHHWYKPTNQNFEGITIEICGGGGGGGAVSTFVAVGGGGCGGGWAIKKGGMGEQCWPAADIPDELILVVGHGGEGGGWTTAVTGVGERDGGSAGITGVIASSIWNAYSTVDDAARLAVYVGKIASALRTDSIMWADGGGGGAGAEATTVWEFNQAGGSKSTSSTPPGARAFGGDFNGVGAGGAGGAGPSITTAINTIHLDLGHGGACGKAFDSLWGPAVYLGSGGFMSLAGHGAPRSGGGSGAHIGNEGGLYGGGGNGGIRAASTGNQRRGGWGGWGVAEITEFYRAST